MLRTIGFACPCVTAVVLTLSAAPAAAAEEDTQLWTTFIVAGEIAPGLETSAQVSLRERSEAAGGDRFMRRLTAEYQLAPSLEGGLAYVEYAGSQELRPHQQLTTAVGPLSFRTRLEERFFAGADRMELRLRQRIQASFVIAEQTDLSTSAELMGLLQTRNRGEGARVDQLRIQIAIRRRLAAQLEASVGYLLIVSPEPGRADRLSHVPQIGVTIRP